MTRLLLSFTALLLFLAFPIASVAQCTADAGTLEGYKPTDCLQLPNGTWVGGIPNGDAFVPLGYNTTFFLSEGPNHVLVQSHNGNLFNVMSFGYYTVHTLVYNSATFDFNLFTLGTSTAFDLFAYTLQGGGSVCASFDLTGTSILIDNPDAGMIFADSAQFCLLHGSAIVSATPDGNQYLPTGYVSMSLLANASGAIIDFDPVPSFELFATGSFSIHTLLFDPNTMNMGLIVLGSTTILDVNALLIQGGGGICAALDVSGAPFDVVMCTGACTADAGTISSDSLVYCYDMSGVQVTATPDGNAVIPPGFQTLFLLIDNPALIIIDTSPTPTFTVSDSGSYQVHMFVHDPATFDPNNIIIGTSSVWLINAMLLQGGGTICGSIGIGGAPFKIVPCDAGCIADPGTITPDSAYYCQDMSGVWTSATPDGNMVVPTGYEVIYILTCGPTYVIKQFSPLPIFAIHDTSDYTIHTMVYDPLTLNLSAVVFGSVVTSDITGLIVQGGGTICAVVDIVGAQYDVIDCANACFADAGGMNGNTALCGDPNGVLISANPDGSMNVPAGHQVLYLLVDASTGVVQQINATPNFTVSTYGDYRIETLVYDPVGFNIGSIVPGTTTDSDINGQLDSGGGPTCGDVDMDGALISLIDCSNGCAAYAGWITPDFTVGCYTDSVPLILAATSSGNFNEPAGFQTTYLLSEGAAGTIWQTNSSAYFTVSDSGDYVIHTLIYDPAAFDPNTLVLGTSTITDVNGLMMQGGGTACGSLDLVGAYFDVQHCDVLCQAQAGTHTPTSAITCFIPSGTLVSATPDNNQVIPPGYLMGYALTYTTDLIVQQASFTPQFTVLDTGLYTIHALVYDPVTLNLSVIIPGTTAAIDLVGLLIQGGGTICASLDLPGAATYVIDCTTGEATATAFQNNELVLWPNPIEGNSHLSLMGIPTGTYTVHFTSIDGRVVQQAGVIVSIHANEPIKMQAPDLAAGTYLLQLQDNGNIFHQRLQIVR